MVAAPVAVGHAEPHPPRARDPHLQLGGIDKYRVCSLYCKPFYRVREWENICTSSGSLAALATTGRGLLSALDVYFVCVSVHFISLSIRWLKSKNTSNWP